MAYGYHALLLFEKSREERTVTFIAEARLVTRERAIRIEEVEIFHPRQGIAMKREERSIREKNEVAPGLANPVEF